MTPSAPPERTSPESTAAAVLGGVVAPTAEELLAVHPGEAAAFGDEEALLLRDGRSVLVRAAHPADAPAIARFLDGLAGEAMAMRVGDAAGARRDEALSVARDGAGGGALLAFTGPDADEIVGVCRYDVSDDGTSAEIAIAVSDDWHHNWLGSGLLSRLMADAQGRGIAELVAHVHASNERMMSLIHSLGALVHERRDGDDLTLRLSTRHDQGIEAAQTSRYLLATAQSLRPMFQPASIAVVGASRRPQSPGGTIFRSLLEDFAGPVYPVHPTAPQIEGHTAYPRLTDIPGPVDLVVVCVPAPLVVQAARDAAAAGARAMIVIASGFEEAGEEGAERAAELTRIAAASGIRVLGPNCLGLAVNDPGSVFNATFGPGRVPPGRMGFASQSGGVGIASLAFCAARRIGLSAFASLGNKLDITSKDLVAYWGQDRHTRAILLYLEGFTMPRSFARLARQVTATTPIFALKSGRGTAGQRAAGSHTAAMAAGDGPTDALLAAAGVVRVDTTQELFEAGQLASSQPLPQGPRVAVISNAGGPAILAADACEADGLQVPAFGAELAGRIREAVPGAAGASNPVDLGASAGPEAYREAARVILDAGVCDSVILICTPTSGTDWEGTARVAAEIADGRVTVAGCLPGRHPDPGDGEWPVPWFAFPESAVRAVRYAHQAAAARTTAYSPIVPLPDTDATEARRTIEAAAPGGWLTPGAVEDVLRAYGIRTARQAVVRSPEAAASVQAQWGVEVAVKLVSSTLTHKSDIGGVILGCDTPQATADAYRAIARAVADAGHAGGMEGALVQEQAGDGVDLIVGAMRDPVFGPVVLAGLGGVEAELWKDRALEIAPVSRAQADGVWDRLQSGELLRGWRGAPARDRAAVSSILVRVGRLISEQVLVAEMDLNPVRALAAGDGAVVLDARIRRSA